MPTGRNVEWVPDAQVTDCPICHKKFGLLLPKHHCRACGRVICGQCSDNTLFLQVCANKKSRVCDTCYEVMRGDKGATLSESFLMNRQVEVSLKADLKEKHAQAEWFRSFLLQVSMAAGGGGVVSSLSESFGAAPAPAPSPPGSAASAPAGAPIPNAPSPQAGDLPQSWTSDGDNLDGATAIAPAFNGAPVGAEAAQDCLESSVAKLSDSEIQTLITRARKCWKEVCSEIASSHKEGAELSAESQELEAEYRAAEDSVRRMKRGVESMGSELRHRAQTEAYRNQLRVTTAERLEELTGLTQRTRALEQEAPPTWTSSGSLAPFLSGPDGSSSSMVLVATQAGRCAERCPGLLRRFGTAA